MQGLIDDEFRDLVLQLKLRSRADLDGEAD